MQDDSLQDDSLQDDSFQDNTNKSAKNKKRTNLKELPRPHKLLQRAPAESVEGGVKISKTCLPLVGPLYLSKVLEEG